MLQVVEVVVAGVVIVLTVAVVIVLQYSNYMFTCLMSPK